MNMRGQLVEKSKGVWMIRIQRRNADGSRASSSEIVRGTKTDAHKRLTHKLREFDTSMAGFQPKQTINEYLDYWLETVAKPRLRKRTFIEYREILRLHVRVPLGQIQLTELAAAHVQQLYSKLQTEKHLSARRVRYVHAILSSSLRKATELDLITRNVAKLVQLPKQVRKEMDVMDNEECQSFLNALNGERLATMFSFALSTGLRPGEYLALQWKDIDLDHGVATVRRAVVRLKGEQWQFTPPKTRGSSRPISLPTNLIAELRNHRRRQQEERLKLGPAWQDHDLVFPSEVGTPLTQSNITQVYKKVLVRAGLRRTLRLYDLRHTHATLLLTAGIHPKVVSERLGHSTIALTLDIYSHVLPSMQAEAAERLNDILFKRAG